MKRSPTWLGAVLAALGLGLGLVGPTVAMAGPANPAPARLTFEEHVRPILKAQCFACHGDEEKPKGHLDLRLARLITRGGESGPALVPGRPDKSLLWERIDADEMPP